MKVIKSFIFILVLAAVTYAGEIPQFDPGSTRAGEMPQFGSTPLNPGEMPQVGPSAANQATNDAMAKILVAVIQNLLSLR
jgi:hypothetical protein